MPSVGGTQIIKKTVARAAGLSVGDGAGYLGRRVMSNVSNLRSRGVRSAALANAAVGAVGGGAYGYATNRDWKGGALTGAALGAGAWSVGGLRGLKTAGVKSGLIGRPVRKASARATAASASTAAQTSAAVTKTSAAKSDAFDRLVAESNKAWGGGTSLASRVRSGMSNIGRAARSRVESWMFHGTGPATRFPEKINAMPWGKLSTAQAEKRSSDAVNHRLVRQAFSGGGDFLW